MLTRRTLLATSAAGLAAPAVIGSAHAATPKNVAVQAKSSMTSSVRSIPLNPMSTPTTKSAGTCTAS